MRVSKLRTVLDRLAHFGGYGCSDTERLLFEFVQGELDPETQRKFEIHISDCPPCLEYIETYRRTIALTREHGLPPVEMPHELQDKLHEFIQQNPDLK
jgi:anti-sigma factor RsiW